MVLLMVNLFAQAEEAVSGEEGATAAKVDDSTTKKVVAPTDAYATTLTGVPTGGNQNVQGQQKPCEKFDANGACVPMPNKSTVANHKGKGLKSKKGGVEGATPAIAK